VTIDYIAKTRAHIARIRAEGGELRFTPWVRTQHFLLMGSFITLAYTGFVHRYPEAFYSYPFKLLENGGYIRGMIHRLAGWGFVALFAVHLVALFCTPRGHAYLRDLWLRMHDLRDSIAQLLFNLRLRQTPPPPRRFNYAEKAEYWALIWGSLVMIVTGVMLIFTETVLRTLPKVWHDVAQVIHFYEAVLATLAILVWHLYWVIYDPKEYPMNPAWLIGKKASHHPDPAPVAGSPATPGGHNQESTPHAPP
jgi:cytochrome b subunit of formate dehydrogenase